MAGEVYHLTPQWTETPMVDTRPLVARVQPRAAHGGGGLELLLAIVTEDNKRPILTFPIGDGPAVYDGMPERGKMVRWGLRKLGPTVWMVSPSIVVPGLHAFVTIIEVPEPAPWTVLSPADAPFVPSDG